MLQPRDGYLTLLDGDVAGVHLEGRALMLTFLVGQRANEGDLVHHLGNVVPTVGDLNAGDVRVDRFRFAGDFGVVGLRIEGLELAGSAVHPEQDHRLALLLKLGRLQAHQVP